MPQPPMVIHLDEIEHVPGPGSLTWLPVRRTLGIEAFGTNAYMAAGEGDDVVEPHTELGEHEDPARGHQELYFVAHGHATFTIDGERHEAPAGTYVFLPDPASHRHAVANEPGTTVLSFGGPPAFQPSAWEWAFAAAPLLRSEPERARSLLAEGLEHRPDDSGSCTRSAAWRRSKATPMPRWGCWSARSRHSRRCDGWHAMTMTSRRCATTRASSG
jgi:mannose-6-phosphate isomerase-like protein (cupin superfamily)